MNRTLLAYLVLILLSFSQMSFGISFDNPFIKPGYEYWFVEDQGHWGRAIRVISNDSITKVEDELRFVSYPYLRENKDPNTPCNYVYGDSWIGKHITMKGDKMLMFFTQDGDTIRLNMDEGYKSYDAYHYANGDVLKQYWEYKKDTSVLGQQDVIAQYGFKRYSTDGFVEDPVNQMKFIVSEKFGIIAMPGFYTIEGYADAESFKHYSILGVKTDAQIYGITRPTNKDFYDFKVGDEFHYYDLNIDKSNYTYTNEKAILKIIDKIFVTEDSVRYLVSRCGLKAKGYTVWDTLEEIDTSNVAFNDTLHWNFNLTGFLSQTYPAIYPNTYVWSNNGGGARGENYNYKVNDRGQLYIQITYLDFYDVDTVNNCFAGQIVTDGEICYPMCIQGLPPFSYCSEEIVYYKKGDEEWGTPYDCEKLLTVSNSEVEMQPNLKIMPNPTLRDYVKVIGLNTVCDYSIVDLSGKILQKGQVNVAEKIEISGIPSGVYLLHLNSKQLRNTLKLIKN